MDIGSNGLRTFPKRFLQDAVRTPFLALTAAKYLQRGMPLADMILLTTACGRFSRQLPQDAIRTPFFALTSAWQAVQRGTSLASVDADSNRLASRFRFEEEPLWALRS